MISLDTNILIYAAQTAPDGRKRRAAEVVAAAALTDAVLPIQALVEFSAACRRQGVLENAAIGRRVAEWSSGFTTVAADPADVLVALDLIEHYSLSFYDALMIATARRAGVTTLISEDMQDGAILADVRIVNPFERVNAARLDALLTPSS